MQVFLGDVVTLVKGDTWVTGQVAGVVLDDKKEIERIHIHQIPHPFWLYEGWMFVDEEEDENEI